MPRIRNPRHVRIFLASPGDVIQERQAARDLLERLEREPLVRRDYTIEVVSWDDPDAPAPMLATLTPQEAVARALPRPSECDVTVVIFWSRMGTPLEALKPDGTPYRSGTEWEFEDARRANRPILLYRRTSPASETDRGDGADQLQQQNVNAFFEQFEGPGGTLRGAYATYDTLEEFTKRLRTDVQTLLPTVHRPDPSLPADAGRFLRAETSVRAWSVGRLMLTLAIGLTISLVAWTAVGVFAEVSEGRDVPALAHGARFLLMALAAAIPVALLVVSWWWLGREKADRDS